MAHALNSNSWEVEEAASVSLCIQGQPSLYSKLQESRNHFKTLYQIYVYVYVCGVCIYVHVYEEGGA